MAKHIEPARPGGSLTVGEPGDVQHFEAWHPGGSITIGDPDSLQSFEILPWTKEQYERWLRTGFPPGSGWEPPSGEQ